MHEVILVLKKETKNFLKRKAMLRWYFWLIIMNSFMLLLPKYEFIPISKNKPLMCIAFMLFTVLLVPNNLTLDLVGGEKYHKTLETLISTPISIRNTFLGKVLFIQILGIGALILITVIDNGLLYIFFSKSFLDAGVSIRWLISMYILVLACIILLSIIGSYVAFNITNLKTGGYIVSLIDILFVYLLVSNLRELNDQYAILTGVSTYGGMMLFANISILSLKKKNIMIHIR